MRNINTEGSIGSVGRKSTAFKNRRADTGKQRKEVMRKKYPRKVKKIGRDTAQHWDIFDSMSLEYKDCWDLMVGLRSCKSSKRIVLENEYAKLKRWSGPDDRTTTGIRDGLKAIMVETKKRGNLDF